MLRYTISGHIVSPSSSHEEAMKAPALILSLCPETACEDGDPALVAAASLVLTGGHGQYISNVHLEPWETEADFHERLYPRYREGLIGKAEEFVRLTKGAEEKEEDARAKTLVIVSLGESASRTSLATFSTR